MNQPRSLRSVVPVFAVNPRHATRSPCTGSFTRILIPWPTPETGRGDVVGVPLSPLFSLSFLPDGGQLGGEREDGAGDAAGLFLLSLCHK